MVHTVDDEWLAIAESEARDLGPSWFLSVCAIIGETWGGGG